ncbi:MAG: hypothetical protein KTR30_06160 [Saprospiraceae bacterium]|nr:hypothetical protein [Saprospiraceae bacterium]
MKANLMNVRFVLCIGTFLFFTACEKTQEDPDPTNTLVGTWDVSAGKLQSPSLGEFDAVTSGTITFRANGTGQENYDYTVAGFTFSENNPFTWISTPTTIVFDGGTSDETVWVRELDQTNEQRGAYTIIQDGEIRTISVTLTK